jgi:hypothetical protein
MEASPEMETSAAATPAVITSAVEAKRTFFIVFPSD